MERISHSYIEKPHVYPTYCSNSTELSKSVLNTTVVSVPYGTEHVTFSVMRKNCYEDALFKCEDEKYVADINVRIFKMFIK